MEIAQHMDAVVTLFVTLGVLTGLIWNRWPAEWRMMAAAVLLILLGVISPATFLSGFANPGIMTIGAPFVVAAGVQETGALRWMLERLLGRPASPSSALARSGIDTLRLQFRVSHICASYLHFSPAHTEKSALPWSAHQTVRSHQHRPDARAW